MTQAKLDKLAKIWIKRLRLQDWDITARFVPHVEGVVVQGPTDGIFGGTSCKASFMEADIQVRSGLDDDETELTLVHELLHVVFGGMQPPEGLYDHIFEVGIEKTARSLVEAYAK